MSSGYFDLHFWADAMSENGFKPWWESIRGYCVAVMFSASFSLIYYIDPQAAIHCRPPLDMNSTLTVGDTTFVNTICFKQVGWFSANIGSLSLICCGLVYISYSWWLLIPRVSRTFSTIRRSDKRLDELKLGAESLKLKALQICFSPDVPKELGISREDAEVITDVCSELWDPQSTDQTLDESSLWSMSNLYFLRNLSSLLPTSGSLIIASLTIAYFENSFTCEVQISTFAYMECTHNLSKRMTPFLILWIASLAALAAFGIVLIAWLACSSCCNKAQMKISRSQPWETKDQDNNFVKMLSMHATSLSNKTKRILCLSSVFSSETRKDPGGVMDRIESEFGNSFEAFFWDLNGKAFFEEMDGFRDLRKLGPKVFTGNGLDEFVELHRQLRDDLLSRKPEGVEFETELDLCRCRYLSQELARHRKCSTVDELFCCVIKHHKKPHAVEILRHFYKHFGGHPTRFPRAMDDLVKNLSEEELAEDTFFEMKSILGSITLDLRRP